MGPCAMVSAGEVRAAIHGQVPARTLDALKRRLWVTAGAARAAVRRGAAGGCWPRAGRDVKRVLQERGGSEVW